MGLELGLDLVPGLRDGDPLAAYRALIASLNPTLWARFDEASGNLINYGSDGNTGTVTGATQGQTGQLGPSEAYLHDGVDDICSFANADIAGTKALTTQRWMFLINATSLGEGSAGVFYRYQSGATSRVLFQSINRLRVAIDTDGTDYNAITNNNQVDFLGVWALLFIDLDDTDAMGLGRRVRIFRATAASPTALLTLGTDTAGTGSIIIPTGALDIGNSAATNQTFDGLIDEVLAGMGLWTPTGSPTDLSEMDQIRGAVF